MLTSISDVLESLQKLKVEIDCFCNVRFVKNEQVPNYYVSYSLHDLQAKRGEVEPIAAETAKYLESIKVSPWISARMKETLRRFRVVVRLHHDRAFSESIEMPELKNHCRGLEQRFFEEVSWLRERIMELKRTYEEVGDLKK